jgi:hypothetical protein
MNTKSHILFYFFIFVFLISCTPQQQTPTIAIQTQEPVSVKLPPTWTQTPTHFPTTKLQQTATVTFTPLPSVTQLPQTQTVSPTSNIPITDRPNTAITPTITATLVNDCNFLALEEGVSLYSAPFDASYSILPTMIPSVTYQAIGYHSSYYELLLNGELVGWADYRLQSVRSEGTGCSSLPVDDREIFEFKSLCFFTTDNRAVDVFHDPDLIQYAKTISGPNAHRVLLRYQNAYFANLGMGSQNIYVEEKKVRTLGDCSTIPKAGIITVDSWLYSQPTWPVGEQMKMLPAGSLIAIHQGPFQGPKPPDSIGPGYWYFVKDPRNLEGKPHGWIWSSNFEFK